MITKITIAISIVALVVNLYFVIDMWFTLRKIEKLNRR